MTVSTLGARMRGLLRFRRPTAHPSPLPRPVPRTEAQALESEELARYDLACRRHGGGTPVSGTVYEEHPIMGQRILIYDLVCPRGHDYRFKRTAAHEMSAAEVRMGAAEGDYRRCPHHRAVPVAGRVYTRDLDAFLDILVYEMTCPVGDHPYVAYESDGG